MYHANLNQFSSFLHQFESYVQPRMAMFDPQKVELRNWNLKRPVEDSEICRQLTTIGANLTATIESLLNVVAVPGGRAGEKNAATLKVLGAELRGSCRDIMTQLDRVSGNLDHRLKFLSLSRDVNQSNNVKMLTLLATVFLPLSLSAGVLSMQSRFRDLGVLLYDFFGVVALLVAIVFIILGIMLIMSFAKDVNTRMRDAELYTNFRHGPHFVMLTVVELLSYLIILASFIVGMFKDVKLGAEILGYGLLATSSIDMSIIIFTQIRLIKWGMNNMRRSHQSGDQELAQTRVEEEIPARVRVHLGVMG